LMFSFVLFAILSALTIFRHAHYASMFREWVYNMETRYYAVFSVLMIQFALYFMLHLQKTLKSAPKVFFYVLLIGIFVEEIFHGTYYCFKQMVVMKEYDPSQLSNRAYFRVMEITKSESAGKSDQIFCSNARDYANLCSLNGVPVYYDIMNLKAPVPCSKPLKLFILVNTKLPGYTVPLLTNPEIKPDSMLKENIYYYNIDIPKSFPN